jgi:hypothetical protein
VEEILSVTHGERRLALSLYNKPEGDHATHGEVKGAEGGWDRLESALAFDDDLDAGGASRRNFGVSPRGSDRGGAGNARGWALVDSPVGVVLGRAVVAKHTLARRSAFLASIRLIVRSAAARASQLARAFGGDWKGGLGCTRRGVRSVELRFNSDTLRFRADRERVRGDHRGEARRSGIVSVARERGDQLKDAALGGSAVLKLGDRLDRVVIVKSNQLRGSHRSDLGSI